MSASSEGEGKGSEFVVRIPIVDSKNPSSESKPEETMKNVAQRILVVDDNRDSASSLAMLLKITGKDTRTAFDGISALEAAAQFQPHVVLLDIGLPNLNGYEVARQLRLEPWSKGIVLIALTGWGQDEDRQKSRDAGFDGHMVKPVELTALNKLLADLLPASNS